MEELGSGFYLAMHDLEIRGAGEVLGDSQSGEMQEVGFNLFTEMLNRAVAALKQGREPDLTQPLGIATEIGSRTRRRCRTAMHRTCTSAFALQASRQLRQGRRYRRPAGGADRPLRRTAAGAVAARHRTACACWSSRTASASSTPPASRSSSSSARNSRKPRRSSR